MNQDTRKGWMSLLAKAPTGQLKELWDGVGQVPDHTVLRAPEVGGVMVRGRTGGTGAPFNLGEMTVTRCSLKLANGTVGHAYVQGRDKDKGPHRRIDRCADANRCGHDHSRGNSCTA